MAYFIRKYEEIEAMFRVNFSQCKEVWLPKLVNVLVTVCDLILFY